MKPHLCSILHSHTSSHLLPLLSRIVFCPLWRNKWPEMLNWRNGSRPTVPSPGPLSRYLLRPMMGPTLCICYEVIPAALRAGDYTFISQVRWSGLKMRSAAQGHTPAKWQIWITELLTTESPSLMPKMLRSLARAAAHAVPVFGAPQVRLMGCQGRAPLCCFSLPRNPRMGCLFHLASQSPWRSGGSCGSPL